MTNRIRNGWLLVGLALLTGACSSTAINTAPVKHCSNARLHVDAYFAGGNFYQCAFDAAGNIRMDIRPEDERINPSPWYAFRLSRTEPGAVDITLDFADDRARYWPKVSYDGHHWQALPESAVSIADDQHTMTLTVPADRPITWIAAQELLTAEWYQQWFRELGTHPGVEIKLLGSSALGRPLHLATTPQRPEFVVLLGRQHPPEITGALAMRPFVQTLMADTELANAFRDRFQLAIAPFMNPDGVTLGHWRHNINGVDLNRDWGTFTQPETASFAAQLQQLIAAGGQPAFMLDFHSTNRSLFYTQLAEDFPGQSDFATIWLDRSRARMPDYEFSHEARARSTQGNTKNWYFGTYGIPAITYEVGDEVARDAIARSSVVFAEEFMRLMLESPTGY